MAGGECILIARIAQGGVFGYQIQRLNLLVDDSAIRN